MYTLVDSGLFLIGAMLGERSYYIYVFYDCRS
jgi:hypothetical protein